MVTKSNDTAERIAAFPGGQSENEWLNAFEYLRSALSDSLETHAYLGCYCIDDFPGYANAGGGARIRAGTGVPGVASDSWEAVLCWSGNRGKRARASALIFPFLNGSAVQPDGRIDDLGPNAEVEQFLLYRFQNGSFIDSGWHCADGPGEWAHVTVPDTIYNRDLAVSLPAEAIGQGSINVDLTIPELPKIRSRLGAEARISLIHVNRNREGTNLVPWTANPPTNLRHTQSLTSGSSSSTDRLRIRLDKFNIRGGWIPGKYHLSLRVQNCHKPTDWAWSSAISSSFELTIV